MSIWSSVEPRVSDIPERDNYTGTAEPVQPRRQGSVDVATCAPWHDCIRLWVDEPGNDIRDAITIVVAFALVIVLAIAAQHAPWYVTRWNFGDHMDRVLQQRCDAGVTAACELVGASR